MARLKSENIIKLLIGISVICFSVVSTATCAGDDPHVEALVGAASKGNTEMIKILIKEEGVDVNSDWFNQTPLSAASSTRKIKIEVVKLLLDNGAKIDNRAVGAAAFRPDILKLFAERGGDISPDKNGNIALITAAENCYKERADESVNILLANGANPSIKEKTIINSALYSAVYSTYGFQASASVYPKDRERCMRIIKALLRHGAEPNAKGRLGDTPKEAALKSNDAALYKIITSKY